MGPTITSYRHDWRSRRHQSDILSILFRGNTYWTQKVCRRPTMQMSYKADRDHLHYRQSTRRQGSITLGSIGHADEEGDQSLELPAQQSLTESQSQGLVQNEDANFMSYINQTRASLPTDQPVFFSDLAPIADSTVSRDQKLSLMHYLELISRFIESNSLMWLLVPSTICFPWLRRECSR